MGFLLAAPFPFAADLADLPDLDLEGMVTSSVEGSQQFRASDLYYMGIYCLDKGLHWTTGNTYTIVSVDLVGTVCRWKSAILSI